MQSFLRHRFRLALLVLGSAALCLFAAIRYQAAREHSHAAGSSSSTRLSSLPPTILWAWERPEDFNFIDTQKIGVAFLSKTLYLRGDKVVSRPRLQPLAVPQGTALIAVARIESEPGETPTLSARQVKDTAEELAELGKLPNVLMVQLDFDATVTQRAFYRALLTDLRAKLPPATLLSITALVSWCRGDNWLDDLPVDEAVPMLFRMGIERNQFLSQLASGARFSAKPCLASAGVSMDEPLTQLQPVQRLYVFNPLPWSTNSVNQLLETYPR